MNKSQILVVDDEPDIRELLEITLSRMDLKVQSASYVNGAKTLLRNCPFDLCLTDMQLPDGDGLELMEYIQVNYPTIPVALITAYGNMEIAIRALKNGAFDFVSKPLDLQVLRNLVNTALKLDGYPKIDARSRHTLLGDSPIMRTIRSKIAKLGRSQTPIHIAGESGTGKELVARLIHSKSPRHEKPFIAVNCGAIPSDLMEAEFFGHKKGAFTGAVSDQSGLFQAADGGCLFLDEVADLPLSLQVKLLRAIQEKAVRPIGSQQEIPVDVRILSATHQNLADLVRENKFRQDLYYRINVIELEVPPLRERREDIPSLIDHILSKMIDQSGEEKPELSGEALDVLKLYSFPGNVRELENILERAIALFENNRIEIEDLNLPVENDVLPDTPEDLPEDVNLESYMDKVEKKAIVNALEQTRWNKTAAARKLGITFRALRYRLKKLELD